MKLSKINAAIRSEPKVLVPFDTPAGRIHVAVQKTALLQGLKDLYPGGRTEETGLNITEEGLLYNETEDAGAAFSEPGEEESSGNSGGGNEVENHIAGLLD